MIQLFLKTSPMKKTIQTLLILSIIPYCGIFGQLKVALPYPVQIYKGQNNIAIVYELHLKDSLSRPISFTNFSIKSDDKILLQDSVYERLPKKSDTNRYVKQLWIDVDRVPKLLIHQIHYKIGNNKYVLSKEVEVKNEPLIIIGFPVKSGIWYMQDGPSPENCHRTFTQATKTRYDSGQDGFKLGYSNQRFAIDFDKVGENGKVYKNNGSKNSDHFCYNEDVIAVADGIVIGVKDSIPDMPNPPKIEKFKNKTDYTGNLVLLDIGDGIIASYAHLLAFSIKVQVGDTLKKGGLIGKIGSSGASTGPHLHFHLGKPDFSMVNKDDINGMFIVSEGISYIFDEYLKYNIVSGEIIDIEGMTEWKSEPFIFNNPVKVKNSLPYDKEIIEIIE
jgi:hypothetical protein